jgi:hypothetical protein
MWELADFLAPGFPDMDASCHEVGYLLLQSANFRNLRPFPLAHHNKLVSSHASKFLNVTFEEEHKPFIGKSFFIWPLGRIIMQERKSFNHYEDAVLLLGPRPHDSPTDWNEVFIFFHLSFEAFRKNVR